MVHDIFSNQTFLKKQTFWIVFSAKFLNQTFLGTIFSQKILFKLFFGNFFDLFSHPNDHFQWPQVALFALVYLRCVPVSRLVIMPPLSSKIFTFPAECKELGSATPAESILRLPETDIFMEPRFLLGGLRLSWDLQEELNIVYLQYFVFDQYFDFSPKYRFLANILIFGRNLDF